MLWLTLGAAEVSSEVICTMKPKSVLFFTLEPLLLCVFVFDVYDAMVSKSAISGNFCDLNVLMYT